MRSLHLLSASLFAVSLAAAPSTAPAAEFGYFGDIGPEEWGDLTPAWETCATGQQQSPVDFRLFPLFTPRPPLSVHYGETEGEIFNNGHTIEVETEGENWINLAGVRYDLLQFHFHTPSEHTVAHQGHDMELHLVHRSADGRLAVIGIFLDRGDSSDALGPIFEQLPDDINVHHHLAEAFDPSEFLTPLSLFFQKRYAGSLTTPPCSQGVSWIVLSLPGSISDEHMAQFAERVRFNARPVQRRVK